LETRVPPPLGAADYSKRTPVIVSEVTKELGITFKQPNTITRRTLDKRVGGHRNNPDQSEIQNRTCV